MVHLVQAYIAFFLLCDGHRGSGLRLNFCFALLCVQEVKAVTKLRHKNIIIYIKFCHRAAPVKFWKAKITRSTYC